MFSAHITGTVQGVGFRAWTRNELLRLGLTGYVRNLPDGSVPNSSKKVVSSSDQTALDQLLALLKSGPPGNRPLRRAVTGVTIEWLDADTAQSDTARRIARDSKISPNSKNPQKSRPLGGISGFEVRF